MECRVLCCRHDLTSPTVIATQRRESPGFRTWCIDVFLDPESNPIKILAQPLILETNTGIRIGLRCRLNDQWFEGLDFMNDPGQSCSFGIGIRTGKLHG